MYGPPGTGKTLFAKVSSCHHMMSDMNEESFSSDAGNFLLHRVEVGSTFWDGLRHYDRW